MKRSASVWRRSSQDPLKIKWKLPKRLGFHKSALTKEPFNTTELFIPAPAKSSESNTKRKLQRQIDKCPVAEPLKVYVTPETAPDDILFVNVEPLLSDMTPEHQPSPAGDKLYTSNTVNKMPQVEKIDHEARLVKREGRRRAKPQQIEVAPRNLSPTLEDEIVAWCSTSTVNKPPQVRAIKQKGLPEKLEERVTLKKPQQIDMAPRNQSLSPKERRPKEHEKRMTQKKRRLTETPAPDRSLSPEVEILSASPVNCAIKRKPTISPPSFTRKYAWIELTSMEVTESEGHSEITRTEVEEFNGPPASENSQSEDEIEVEILPQVEGIRRRQRKKLSDDTPPPLTSKCAWMEIESEPTNINAELVEEERKTEGVKYESTPPETEKHDSIETLDMHITQRQDLFVLPPLPIGDFIPLPNESQYFQRQNNTQKPALNANKKQKSSVNIMILKEWRDSRKRLQKEREAKNQEKEQLLLVLKERYFNDPRMHYLLVNRHNRFNQCL